MLSIAAYGPSSTARKVPPTRCPLVPNAIGKLIICAANTNALDIASKAVMEREYVAFAFFHDHARKARETIHIATAAAIEGALVISPSGMCSLSSQ